LCYEGHLMRGFNGRCLMLTSFNPRTSTFNNGVPQYDNL